MSNPSLRRSLACATVAAALALAGNNADAVVYGSSFDPPNFFGTATFDVSQACLDAGNGFQTNGGPPAGCTISWLSATVTFNDPFAPTTFSYVPAFLPSLSAVNQIWVQAGELAGVDSMAIGPMIISGNPNATFNGPWWIQFVFSPELSSPSNGEFGLGIVNLFTGTCTSENLLCVRNPNPSSVAQVENFTRVSQVPEPGTLALLLGTLGCACLVRRRAKVAA